MNDHLTTEPTGHFAGEHYRLPDGTPRYFTREHVAHMERLNAQSRLLTRDDTHAIQQAQPKAAKARKKTKSFAACDVCGTRYQVMTKNAKTCSPYCSGVLYQRTQAKRDRSARKG